MLATDCSSIDNRIPEMQHKQDKATGNTGLIWAEMQKLGNVKQFAIFPLYWYDKYEILFRRMNSTDQRIM
jgi:hypothetical protein